MGSRKYQNDVHGTVVTTTYAYGPGEYDIWLEHWDTLDWVLEHCEQAGYSGNGDYDWEAKVEQVGGEALVTIEDPQGA